MPIRRIPMIRRLAGDTRGAALVEFAITFPFLLLIFAMIVEGSRMFWSYQTAIVGVRDATRYLARVAPADICSSGGSLSSYVSSDELKEIVNQNLSDPSIFAVSLVTVDSATPSLACESGTTVAYRNEPVSVATVSAQLTIQFPFSGLFTLAGFTRSAFTMGVSDSSRIFGT